MKKGYKISIYGEIPEEWHIVELGEYVNIKSGESPSLFELAEEGTTPYLKVEDLNNSTKYQNLSRNYINSNFNHAPKGSIIFPKRGASILLNKIRISKREVLMDSNLMAIFPKDNRLDSEFLFYLINSINLSRIADTSSIPQINNKHITPLKVVYPPLPEQQKIADILTTLDDKLENIESQIAEYTTLKTGLMQQLLTKGIGHTKFVDSELGMIPEGWKVGKLSTVMTIRHGKDQKAVIKEKGKYPILGTSGEIGRTDSFLYDKPSVLIGRKGTIDRPQYMETPFWTIDTLFYSEISNGIYPKWLYYCFLKINWRHYNEASGVPSLSSRTISNIPITIPSLTEQQKIAEILSSVDDKLESLQQKKEEFSNLKKGLMEQLLTGRIRVKV